jgi:ATP-dependent Lon protease
VFPNRIVPLFVGREKSVAALEVAMVSDKQLFSSRSLIPARTIQTATPSTTSA